MPRSSARSRATGVGVVVSLVVAGGLSACSHAESPEQATAGSSSASASPSDDRYQPTDKDLAAIRTALRTRSRAVLTKDRRAFLSVVDRSDPRLVASEKALFANLTAMPLESYAVKVAPTYFPPVGVGSRTTALMPLALEEVQVRGVDRAPAGYPVQISWIRRGDTWLIAADRSPDPGIRHEAADSRPWFGEPITVRSEGDTVVLVDRSNAARADPLLAKVRKGIETDARILGIEPRFSVLVDASANGAASKMNTVDDEEAAAVSFQAFSRQVDGDYRGIAGSRIKINPGQIAAIVDDDRVLRHELVHFLTAGRGVTPIWVSEGLAEYVSRSPYGPSDHYYPAEVHRRLQRVADQGPPESGLFGLDPMEDYVLSWCAVIYLVRARGMATFRRFADDFTGEGDAFGDSELPTLLRRHYDLGPRELRDGTATLVRSLHSQ